MLLLNALLGNISPPYINQLCYICSASYLKQFCKNTEVTNISWHPLQRDWQFKKCHFRKWGRINGVACQASENQWSGVSGWIRKCLIFYRPSLYTVYWTSSKKIRSGSTVAQLISYHFKKRRSIELSWFHVNGFKLYRRDRVKGEGGIAYFVHDHITAVRKRSTCTSLECLLFNTVIGQRRFDFISAYKPLSIDNNTFTSEMSAVLDNATSMCDNIASTLGI